MPEHTDELAARSLIQEIVDFNRNYKRKPKKYRKLGAPNLEMLDSIAPEQLPPYQLYSETMGTGFFATSRTNFQEEDEEDEINPMPKIEVAKAISRPNNKK